MPEPAPIVKQLVDARLKLALSVEAVAGAIQTTPETIRNWESGRNHPRIIWLDKWAQALGFTVHLIWNGKLARECLYCGEWVQPVNVMGHLTCPACNSIMEVCCE